MNDYVKHKKDLTNRLDEPCTTTKWGTLITLLICLVIVSLVVVGVAYYNGSKAKAEKQPQTQDQAQVEVAEAEVQEVQEPTPYVYVPYSDEYYEDLDLLAHLIYSEDEENGECAMWYTGSVVLNRVNDPNYPNTLYDVIYQSGQYQVTWNGGLYKDEPSDVAYEVAAELMQTGGIIPDEVLYSAEFIQHYGVYDKIGKTYYCY